MKSDYKTRAMRFLEEIYPYLDLTDPYNCAEGVYQYNYFNSRKVLVRHGSVRIALITSDYVIKYDYDEWGVKRYGGCNDEVEFYNFAKEKGYSYLFAEITPFKYKGHMFYIMPRINGVGRFESYVYNYLDEEDLDFVNDYLYDMHEENYGWKNKYPIIVDYALNVFFEKRREEEYKKEVRTT